MSFGDDFPEYRAEKAVSFDFGGTVIDRPVHNYRFAVWVDGSLIDIMRVDGLETHLTGDGTDIHPATVQLSRGVKSGDKRLRELLGSTVNVKVEVRTGAQLGHDPVLRFRLDGAYADRHGYEALDAGGNQLLIEYVDFVVPEVKVEDL